MHLSVRTVPSTFAHEMSTVEATPFIRTIEWDMMDKSKFFPLSMLSSFSVRCCLYPLTVIKTRLQVQRQYHLYTGMIDACRKIYKTEGIPGLYRGFWISSIQIVSGVFYVSTYEGVRHLLSQDTPVGRVNSKIKALVAGGAASLVGQTIVVPFDVLSQHLMVLGMNNPKHSRAHLDKMEMNPLRLNLESGRTRAQISADIIRKIYQKDGYRGFYRGYVASLCAYVPNSALWWGLYTVYQDELIKVFPGFSHLCIQAIAGTLGGFTTTIITNPLDIVRARLQVQRLNSMFGVFGILWVEEGLHMFTKGLSARLVQSACFSFTIILGYETIKRISIIDEYKSYVRW